MDLNGARSNPQAKVELFRLAELHGRLVAKSVKGTLAMYSCGEAPRFRRVSRGVYQMARSESL